MLARRGVDARDPQARGTRACAACGRGRRTSSPSRRPRARSSAACCGRRSNPSPHSGCGPCVSWRRLRASLAPLVSPSLFDSLSRSEASSARAASRRSIRARSCAGGASACVAFLVRMWRRLVCARFDLARAGLLEALGGAPMRLHLRHLNSPRLPWRGRRLGFRRRGGARRLLRLALRSSVLPRSPRDWAPGSSRGSGLPCAADSPPTRSGRASGSRAGAASLRCSRCTISRPRNITVTFTLSPSIRKRRALLQLEVEVVVVGARPQLDFLQRRGVPLALARLLLLLVFVAARSP